MMFAFVAWGTNPILRAFSVCLALMLASYMQCEAVWDPSDPSGVFEVAAEEKAAPVRPRVVRIADYIPPNCDRVKFVMSIYKEAVDLYMRSRISGCPIE